MDHTALSLCLPFVERNVSLSWGQCSHASVGGARVTGEMRESESEFLLALQRAPALCVARISGSGYHHLLSTWHTFCQPDSQAQLFMNNAN